MKRVLSKQDCLTRCCGAVLFTNYYMRKITSKEDENLPVQAAASPQNNHWYRIEQSIRLDSHSPTERQQLFLSVGAVPTAASEHFDEICTLQRWFCFGLWYQWRQYRFLYLFHPTNGQHGQRERAVFHARSAPTSFVCKSPLRRSQHDWG